MSFFIDSSKHTFGKNNKESNNEGETDKNEEDWPEPCDQTETINDYPLQVLPLKEKENEVVASKSIPDIYIVSAEASPSSNRTSMFSLQRIFKFGNKSVGKELPPITSKKVESEKELADTSIPRIDELVTKRKEPASPTLLCDKTVPKKQSIGHVHDCGTEIETNLQRLVLTLRSLEKPSRDLADEYRGKIRILCDIQYK